MKVYKFKRVKSSEPSEVGGVDCFVHLTSPDEVAVWDATHNNYTGQESDFWDYYLKERVGLTDIDVYEYMLPGWTPPLVGEEYQFEENGDVWVRVEG